MHKLILVALLLILILPGAASAQDDFIVQLPELTGSYDVGKIDLHLIDDDREEIFTDDEDDVRELMVRVYYPADVPADAEPAPYAEGAFLEAIASANGVPPMILSGIFANGYVDVPVSKAMENYPVLIFSPGFGNNPLFYTSLLEEIASNGYIIVSMNHPYSTDVTVYPDERVVEINELGSLNTEEQFESVGQVWVADALFVLDQLETWNADDPVFADTLDLERIGMFGHSYGGATAAESMYQDERIDAAINMDGSFFGAVKTESILRPFMLMRAIEPEVTEEELAASGIDAAEYEAMLAEANLGFTNVINNAAEGYIFLLEGSVHNTYTTDWPQLSTAPLLSALLTEDIVGAIEPARGFTIISNYVLAFFDTHLNAAPSPLLDGPSDEYPEVTFESPANS